MGVLDGLAGQVLGSLAGSGAQRGGLASAIGGLIAQHPGGLAGLINDFQRGGLGNVASSWVGKGANMAISPEQIQSVLGGDRMQAFAAASGMSAQDASAGVADLLPQIIDGLTPDGTLPDQNTLGSLLGALTR